MERLMTYKKVDGKIIPVDIFTAKEALLMSLTEEERNELCAIMERIREAIGFNQTFIRVTIDTDILKWNSWDKVLCFFKMNSYRVEYEHANTYGQLVYTIEWWTDMSKGD